MLGGRPPPPTTSSFQLEYAEADLDRCVTLVSLCHLIKGVGHLVLVDVFGTFSKQQRQLVVKPMPHQQTVKGIQPIQDLTRLDPHLDHQPLAQD
jgi:hypothetical protein